MHVPAHGNLKYLREKKKSQEKVIADKKKIPINFKKFDKDSQECLMDILLDKEYLVIIEEKIPGHDVNYAIDVAISYGDYLDGFWNTGNDWIEGNPDWWHVVAYCDLRQTWTRNPMEV